MQYALGPVIYAKSANAALKIEGSMSVSAGNPELAITATQWQFDVSISTNARPAPFETVENMLRSFLAGTFCGSTGLQMYEQTVTGFTATFAPDDLQPLSGSSRREVKRVHVSLDFVHTPMSQESVFPQLLDLADYAFVRVVKSMATVAPLVFDGMRRERLIALTPLLRPIALALKLDAPTGSLEKLCENGVLKKQSPKTRRRNAPNEDLALIDPALQPSRLRAISDTSSLLAISTWTGPGLYFSARPFEHRQFIVLTDGGDDLHQPVFFNSIAT